MRYQGSHENIACSQTKSDGIGQGSVFVLEKVKHDYIGYEYQGLDWIRHDPDLFEGSYIKVCGLAEPRLWIAQD